MRRIGLIATDLDGTLVDEGSPDMDPGYYEAIRKLTDMGIRVAAFTGRHIDSARRLFEPVADLLTYVCDNGAIIGTGDRIVGPWNECGVLQVLQEILENGGRI